MSDTLAQSARFEQQVRKSRFLVQAAPVESPEAALEYLEQVADRSASHNCWAYRVGQQYRFSDDGEPAGTSGKPILAAIDGQRLDRVMAVVTRWFGGIKLGAGGLMRAYGGSTAECLRLAPRRTIVLQREAVLQCDFAHAGMVHDLLASHAATKLDEHYDADGLRLRLQVPENAFEALGLALRDATRGQASIDGVEPDAELQ